MAFARRSQNAVTSETIFVLSWCPSLLLLEEDLYFKFVGAAASPWIMIIFILMLSSTSSKAIETFYYHYYQDVNLMFTCAPCASSVCFIMLCLDQVVRVYLSTGLTFQE